MKKIQFFSVVDGLATSYPIVESARTMPKWIHRAREQYKNKKEQAGSDRFPHIYKCPGVIDLMATGYIVTAWHDFVVRTEFGREGFGWTVPSNNLQELMPDRELLSSHTADGVTEHIPRSDRQSSTIVKVNTPWHVVVPKGIKLLVLPLAYPDHDAFEAAPGILDPGVSSEINIQLWWNVLDGEHQVNAGDPLAQIIPLSEEQLELLVRDATSWDQLWVKKKKFFESLSFTTKRPLIKKNYQGHFE